MRQLFVHDEPDRCVVGTVGEPGARTFFLQVRSGTRVNAVVLEKEQVALLADRLLALLADVSAPAGQGDRDDGPLDAPIEADFRVSSLGLGWNSQTSRVVVEAHADTESEVDIPDLEDDAEGPDTLRIRLTAPAARAFAARAQAVVAAGRPPCPFCDLPLDPAGHICPRANGYRR